MTNEDTAARIVMSRAPAGMMITGDVQQALASSIVRALAAAEARGAAAEREEQKKLYRRFAVHLSHCNFGENEGACKYGDDDCPALTESWSWFSRALSRDAALRAGRAGE